MVKYITNSGAMYAYVNGALTRYKDDDVTKIETKWLGATDLKGEELLEWRRRILAGEADFITFFNEVGDAEIAVNKKLIFTREAEGKTFLAWSSPIEKIVENDKNEGASNK